MRSYIDQLILIYFVSCGIARLARYNATVALLPKDGKGKVTYFEGTPIPTSLLIVMFLGYNFYYGNFKEGVMLGEMKLGALSFHYLTLVYAALGSCMISRSLRIPKL